MNNEQLCNMALHKALPEMGGNIKLGFKDGSGFVYCGEVPDAMTLLGIDRQCVERQEKAVASAEKKLTSLCREMEVLAGKIADQEKDIKKKRTRLEERKCLLRSEIAEVYKSIDEEDTYIVIIDGDDNGDYWTTEEMKEGKSG